MTDNVRGCWNQDRGEGSCEGGPCREPDICRVDWNEMSSVSRKRGAKSLDEIEKEAAGVGIVRDGPGWMGFVSGTRFCERRGMVRKTEEVWPADEKVLDMPAKVGNTTFGVRIPERFVVAAAKRAHENALKEEDDGGEVDREFRRVLVEQAERAAFLDSHPLVSEELAQLIEENEKLRDEVAKLIKEKNDEPTP